MGDPANSNELQVLNEVNETPAEGTKEDAGIRSDPAVSVEASSGTETDVEVESEIKASTGEDSEVSESEEDRSDAATTESSEESSSTSGEEEELEEGGSDQEMNDEEFAFLEEDGFGSGSDEEVAKGPIRSKHELEVLAPVPKIEIQLEPHHRILPVGKICSIICDKVIVEGSEAHNPLNEGSILWISESRTPLGIVDELFGPVKTPYYCVRFNSDAEVPHGISEGTAISFVPEFVDYILSLKEFQIKGYDASGENDEELVGEREFSDDEKEAEYRKSLRQLKRPSSDEQHRSKKTSFSSMNKPRSRSDGRRKTMDSSVSNPRSTGLKARPPNHASAAFCPVSSLGAGSLNAGVPARGTQPSSHQSDVTTVHPLQHMASMSDPTQQMFSQQRNVTWRSVFPFQQQQQPNFRLEDMLASSLMQNLFLGVPSSMAFPQSFASISAMAPLQQQPFANVPGMTPRQQQPFANVPGMTPLQQHISPSSVAQPNPLWSSGQLCMPISVPNWPLGNFADLSFSGSNMQNTRDAFQSTDHGSNDVHPPVFSFSSSSYSGPRPPQRGRGRGGWQ